ncbi:MAG TPA: hypothetical protein VI386_23430, partial [Candidatus Sulfotelmatobacter sp.]
RPSSPKSHKRKSKKSIAHSGCTPTPPAGATSASAKTKATPAANANTKSNSSNTDCPPPKTVITNGGAAEPAVQLTGGEDAAKAQDRSTTDQMLGTAEDNLKKISGKQLTVAEQDMVSQIRQYMDQSKEAVTAGDTERGRTLAQKAQLLSDELAKP